MVQDSDLSVADVADLGHGGQDVDEEICEKVVEPQEEIPVVVCHDQ